MAMKKRQVIIKTVPTFRYLLLCFRIVFVEHLRSLNETKPQQTRQCLKHVLSQHVIRAV